MHHMMHRSVRSISAVEVLVLLNKYICFIYVQNILYAHMVNKNCIHDNKMFNLPYKKDCKVNHIQWDQIKARCVCTHRMHEA